jgi:hypothetical protein
VFDDVTWIGGIVGAMKWLGGLCCLAACSSGGAGGVAPEDDGGEPVVTVDASAKDGATKVTPTPTPTGDGAVMTPSPDAPPVAGWWNPAWHKRARITITDPELKETLSDFQVSVKLEAGFEYAAARSDGADLRFVTEEGALLDHEIDLWNPAGASWIWLRVPKLAPGATVLHLYYGNPDPPKPVEDPALNVWPEPYAGVWHLSGSGKDSTAHGFDGAMMSGGVFTDGRMAKGLTLDGSKHEHITLKPDIKLVAGAPGCTFSAWINPTKIEDSVNGMIIMTVGKWFNNNHNSYTDFNINASGQMISHVDPGANTAASGYARILSDPGFVKTNEWAWVTYVIDLPAKEERFFKNGQLVSTKPPPAGKAWADAFIDMVSTRVVIGSEEDVVSHHYTGSMDELRLEKGMRSPAWIAAQYRSMTAAGYVKVEADQ